MKSRISSFFKDDTTCILVVVQKTKECHGMLKNMKFHKVGSLSNYDNYQTQKRNNGESAKDQWIFILTRNLERFFHIVYLFWSRMKNPRYFSHLYVPHLILVTDSCNRIIWVPRTKEPYCSWSRRTHVARRLFFFGDLQRGI